MGASRNTTVAEFGPKESSLAAFGITGERLAGQSAITRHPRAAHLLGLNSTNIHRQIALFTHP
jgi:hypothetical protein